MDIINKQNLAKCLENGIHDHIDSVRDVTEIEQSSLCNQMKGEEFK